jgi:hypothetical protein
MSSVPPPQYLCLFVVIRNRNLEIQNLQTYHVLYSTLYAHQQCKNSSSLPCSEYYNIQCQAFTTCTVCSQKKNKRGIIEQQMVRKNYEGEKVWISKQFSRWTSESFIIHILRNVEVRKNPKKKKIILKRNQHTERRIFFQNICYIIFMN